MKASEQGVYLIFIIVRHSGVTCREYQENNRERWV